MNWLNNRLYTSKKRTIKSEKKLLKKILVAQRDREMRNIKYRSKYSKNRQKWSDTYMCACMCVYIYILYINIIYIFSKNFSLRERMKQRKYLAILWLKNFPETMKDTNIIQQIQ